MSHDYRTILLVEDSDEDYEASVRGLRQGGLRNPILRCETGDEALDFLYQKGEHANAAAPALILLDLNLPGTDGLEVLRTIKGDPERRSIPVVILTTSSDGRDVERCYEAGANTFVRKPVEIAAFLESLARLGSYWFEVVVLPRDGAA